MKISVKKKYLEMYRQASWRDVKEAFIFFLKRPNLLVIIFVLGVWLLFSWIFNPDYRRRE